MAMDEEKKVDEKVEVKVEKKAPLKKWKKILGITVATLVITLLIIGVILSILFGDELNNRNKNVIDNVSNVYRFSGELLFSKDVDNYTFVVEFCNANNNVGDIVIDFLYRNMLVSQKKVAENIDTSNCNDYGIFFKDYNNDGMLDFSYITSRNGEESNYKIYTLTTKGEIVLLTDEEYSAKTSKFSPAFNCGNGVYSYSDAKVFYDGYEVKNEVGDYKLISRGNDKYQKINAESKLSFSDNRSIDAPKTEKINDLGENFFERHSLLKKYETYTAISVDLDNDQKNEKIVCFSDDNNGTRIIAFDSEDEVITTLVNLKDKKYSLDEIVELADLDGDEVAEIITRVPGNSEINICKYQWGYFFPKIIYN